MSTKEEWEPIYSTKNYAALPGSNSRSTKEYTALPKVHCSNRSQAVLQGARRFTRNTLLYQKHDNQLEAHRSISSQSSYVALSNCFIRSYIGLSETTQLC